MKIRTSLKEEQLAHYTASQINCMFSDKQIVTAKSLQSVFPQALTRLKHCFLHINNKYFFDDAHVVFNHLHGDQYAMWLYILSNELFRQKFPNHLCNKVFLLNKMLHGCDIFYEVTLPSIFLLVHPLGTVLGRGSYSDYFVAYQRCGIGSNHDIYPSLGLHVTLRPGSSVLGDSKVGDYCQIAAEALVIDKQINDNTTFMGRPGYIRLISNPNPYPLWRTNK